MSSLSIASSNWRTTTHTRLGCPTLVRVLGGLGWDACTLTVLLLLSLPAYAKSKPHVIAFGKAQTVAFPSGVKEDTAEKMTVRPLYVDDKLKEYATGESHDVTDRLFVVRRAFRLNDRLPEEKVPHWLWQRGGWMLIDRLTAHISALNLPEFDGFYSVAVWYRDYAAYCGISADGEKLYGVVAQIGSRKPLLRRVLGDPDLSGQADTACEDDPIWQRQPPRVTFSPAKAPKLTFTIRGHTADLVEESSEE